MKTLQRTADVELTNDQLDLLRKKFGDRGAAYFESVMHHEPSETVTNAVEDLLSDLQEPEASTG